MHMQCGNCTEEKDERLPTITNGRHGAQGVPMKKQRPREPLAGVRQRKSLPPLFRSAIFTCRCAQENRM